MASQNQDHPPSSRSSVDSAPVSSLSPLQRAIFEMEKMEAKLVAFQRAKTEPIAIIGMGCRFPGGGTHPEAFWRALKQGVDAVREIPVDRWPADAIPNSPPGTRWAGLLDAVDGFDARFFGISPREATSLDPQQRLLLEVSWEALEDAGQPSDLLMRSRTGVFVGISNLDYRERAQCLAPDEMDAYATTGNIGSTAAGRLSYVLGLEGPCLSIDTACSSSLVAVHIACQSLRIGESELALAGGVNLVLSPATMQLASKTQALSPEGRCKTFDAGANGYVRAEGCGVVVLKRLSSAQRDGDRIWALIRSSAVNHDGRSTGLTTPNVLSQQALLRAALANGRVSPSDVGYVEAHGTGTSLGDPIEYEALKEVLGAPRADGSSCALGSVKANLGHLEPAAGVAGLIKTVLALHHGEIPRLLHFQRLNPRISLDGTPFVLPTKELPWKRGKSPRIAGVSSFGISGTNAHVVLEEAPQVAPVDPSSEESFVVLPLSAKSPEALAALGQSYRSFLTQPQTRDSASLGDIVYTASVRRSHHEHRLTVVGRSRQEIAEALEAFGRGEEHAAVARGEARAGVRPKVVFVFSGQGSNWMGVGRELLLQEPVFRGVIEACDELLRPYAGWSLLEELRAPDDRSRLSEAEVVQPALFAIQVALAALWSSWGVTPEAVIGHSIGEVAAAHVAGALSLAEAVRVVYHRGRLLQQATGLGKMVAAALSAERAGRELAGYEGRVAIAAINDPDAVLLSGEAGALKEIVARLEGQQVECRELRMNYPSHSPQMAPFSDGLIRALGTVEVCAPAVPMYSTVTGTRLASGPDGGYWGRNLREPVNLVSAVDAAIGEGHEVFVEVSPHPAVWGHLKQCLSKREKDGTALFSLRRGQEERRTLLGALGVLYTKGYPLDWKRLAPAAGRCVPLPAYPWQRQRYWIDAAPPGRWRDVRTQSPGHPLLGAQVPVAGVGAVFEALLGLDNVPYMADHLLAEQVVVPGIVVADMVRAAGAAMLGAARLSGFVLQALMILPETGHLRVQVVFGEATAEGTPATVYSQPAEAKSGDGWKVHAKGYVQSIPPGVTAPAPVDLHALRARCRTPVSMPQVYATYARHGLLLGPSFQGVIELWEGTGEVIARVELPTAAGEGAGAHSIHPAFLDTAAQTVAVAVGIPQAGQIYPPFMLTSLTAWERGATSAWVHARATVTLASGAEVLSGDFTMFDEDGEVLVEVSGFGLKRTDPRSLRQAGKSVPSACLCQPSWQEASWTDSPGEVPLGRWVVLTCGSALGTAVVDRLRAAGAQCITVARGASAERRGEDGFVVDPGSPEVFGPVLEAMSGGQPLSGVVFLWGAETPNEQGVSPADAAEELLVAGFSLVQALIDHAQSAPRLVWVTEGAQAAVVGDDAAVVQAPLWGLGRVVMKEHPELGCRLVDMEPGAKDAAEALWRELCHADSETQVAWRSGKRHVLRLVKVPASLDNASPLPLSADSTVLITGGLGGLGLLVARWLWEEHRVRHLVLVGRHAPVGEALSEVEALRAAGADVTVAQADVANAEEVRALLASLPAEPPLRGVIHAAGVLSDGMLTEQDATRIRSVLAPKVRGAWNLHIETRHLSLSCFVLFSSAATLLGAAGQGNYAAANAFLDALAHARRAAGLPAQSINWGPWAERGLAAALDVTHQERLARQGIGMLSPADGLSLLRQALVRPEAQLGALSLDLRALQQAYGTSDIPPLWRALVERRAERARAQATGAWAARLQGLAPAARASEVEAAVRADMAKVIGLTSASEVPLARAFREQGMDSLMAIELRNALAARTGRPLPATLVFDYPTVGALSRYLLDKVLLSQAASPDAPPRPPVTLPSGEPIAIVGIGCRYPGGVKDLESFWRLLEQGVDAIREIPPDRWDVEAYYDPDPDMPGKMMTRFGGFLEDVDLFDAEFFGISRREAVKMDPQQRLLLEMSWEALEQAGIAPERLMGSNAGVFVGMMCHDYELLQEGPLEHLDGYVATGSAASIASGRISYLLGATGPSITIDTACSSSLVTMHLACQSLRAGECSVALAGGVTLMLTPRTYVEFSRLRVLSPTGRCKSFDTSADGTIWSEGGGMMVLKRLSEAERDGDPILALIRGSAVNQDGRSNGLTAPNGPSQEAVIRRALAQAGVPPSAVGYVEAHGTGTPLGDPIEMQALGAALREGRAPDQPVVVGSVKSNLGHTQAAAGAAGVIKAVLSLQRGVIPRTLHFTSPNPHIPWAALPVKVAVEPVPWKANGAPRIAGVSAFALGGTNAHVVLEEAPRRAPSVSPGEASAVLLPLSAKSPEALMALAEAYGHFLAGAATETSASVRDIAYTAGVRRSHYEHRLALVGRTREELSEGLGAFLRGEERAGAVKGQVKPGARPRLVFVFSGQGSQWAGMGRELLLQEPVFRGVIETCDRLLRPYAGWSLLEELGAPDDRSRLSETEVAQPALFAIEVALAALWSSWGITPEAVIGHSVGEVSAAHVAGALSLAEAVRLVHQRGRVMQQATGLGKMVAVALSAERARRALEGYEGRVAIAAINDPGAVVLSGEVGALSEVVEHLSGQQVDCRELRVNYAFHGPQMAPLAGELKSALGELETCAVALPMYSTVTGARLAEALGAEYWARNIREPVNFASAVGAARADGHQVFMEVGPHPVLRGHLEQCLSNRTLEEAVLSSLRRGQEERTTLLGTLGALHVQGCAVDWQRLHPQGGRCVSLPTYAWQRQRYWIEARGARPREGSDASDTSSAVRSLLDAKDGALLAAQLGSMAAFSTEELPIVTRVLEALKARAEQARADAAIEATFREELEVAPARERRRMLEGWLQKMVVDTLGASASGRVQLTTRFLDLGMDSLMSLELRRRLSASLGIELSVNWMFSHRTMALLLDHLLDNLGLPATSSDALTPKRPRQVHLPVVELQPSGGGTPFFCMHPAGGPVLCYAELARHLGTDRPFYGLQAMGVEGDAEPDLRVVDMAERYVEAIRSVQPSGPYLLGGWSLGGVLALETAQQLVRSGERVNLLALFDSFFTAWCATLEERTAMDASLAVMLNPERSYEEMCRLDPREVTAFIADDMVKANHAGFTESVKRLLPLHDEALWQYLPTVYPGRVTFFRASQQPPDHAPGEIPDLYGAFHQPIERLSLRPIEIHEVPGNHFTLISDPHVRLLAERLRECLRVADGFG